MALHLATFNNPPGLRCEACFELHVGRPISDLWVMERDDRLTREMHSGHFASEGDGVLHHLCSPTV